MSARRAERWTARLRRRTTTGQWLPEIDGLRFIAIASVLLFHIQGQLDHRNPPGIPHTWWMRAVGFGHRGVPLFFVLSGFILTLPFARSRLFGSPVPSLRRYYLRRVTRLEPPYLLNLAVVAAGTALFDHQAWRALLPHLAASAAYLHYAIFHTPSTINSVAWSLEVEMQFYLLAPLLAMVFALGRAWLRRTVLVLAIVLSASLRLAFGLSQFTLAGDLQYFLAGLLLADLYLARTDAPHAGLPSRRLAWDLTVLAAAPAFFLLSDRFSVLWLPGVALLLCLAGLRGRIASRILRTPAIAISGGMCYTIYLWHAPVLTVVDRILRHAPSMAHASYSSLFLMEAVLKTLAVLLVCLPLFILVERPCMDPEWWQSKFAPRRRRTAEASAQLGANPTYRTPRPAVRRAMRVSSR